MNGRELAIDVGGLDPKIGGRCCRRRSADRPGRSVQIKTSRKTTVTDDELVRRGAAAGEDHPGIGSTDNAGRQGRRQVKGPTCRGMTTASKEEWNDSQQHYSNDRFSCLVNNMNARSVLLDARAGQVQCHCVTSCGISGVHSPRCSFGTVTKVWSEEEITRGQLGSTPFDDVPSGKFQLLPDTFRSGAAFRGIVPQMWCCLYR